MSDKPNLIKPKEKSSGWFDYFMARFGGIISLIGIISAMGYLIIPLTVAQDFSCDYRGQIEIYEPFKSEFEKSCLVMGPPISRYETLDIEGYGSRTIQYFEGVLLMVEPDGSSLDVEVFPLGEFLEPESQPTVFLPDPTQFYATLAETGNDQFVGEPVTSFIQMGDRLVIYFENTSLRWNLNSQTISHQSLGRVHLNNNYPDLLVEGEVTQLFIPRGRIRGIPINTLPELPPADDYAVHVSVKHPILYANDQQVVTVEVINRTSSQPVDKLEVSASVQFSDLEDTGAAGIDINLEPTDTPGIYTTTIDLPDHPDGIAGREVLIDILVVDANDKEASALKKFQTWW